MKRLRLFCLLGGLLSLYSACTPSVPSTPAEFIRLDPAEAAQIADSLENAISSTVADGLQLSLWASDSLLADPVALTIDEQGRIYTTRTNRQKNSEFDIRGHRDWMTRSIGLQSVEDRRAFLRSEFATERSDSNLWLKDLNNDSLHDWHDLTVEREEVYRIWDESGDGLADVAQLFLRDFHTEVTDVAGGIGILNGDVYLAIAPDLWRLEDRNGDGMMDKKTSLSHGYQAHIGFSGHGMSGVTVGPDGRIYWGIGDIGFNVIDKTGKQWKYPNQGAIFRCNPDGSDFEVFAAGMRNTHEFVFDEYGNIISSDNDGDHPGESERLVYITHGSDAGWRANWQYGKYTDPDNNRYKVWMDEELYKARQASTPAYIVPPIRNYYAGPAGMVYNTGTALSQKWRNYFFLVSFTGSPGSSPIIGFRLKPEGAGFAFDGEEEVLRGGVLPTGIEIGPDGAIYIADWIDGWGTKNYGRIWRLDDPAGAQTSLRKETEALIKADFGAKNKTELKDLLAHPDQRVRQKAQFTLVDGGLENASLFVEVAQSHPDSLARVHGLWGLWQLARQDAKQAEKIIPFLTDPEPEIRTQAAKILGDIRYVPAAEQLVPLLGDPSARVQFFAAEAIGRIGYSAALPQILAMLEANDEKDVYLRHAGSLALSRIARAEDLVALAGHESRALRIAAVVALRRMQDPGVEVFLQDADEFIVLEAARAINDDFSIEAALPALASLLKTTNSSNEALLRRILNACLRVGREQDVQSLIKYLDNGNAPAEMRAEAMEILGVWGKPSVLDRVDGRYRGEINRSDEVVRNSLTSVLPKMLKSSEEVIRLASANTMGRLKIEGSAAELLALLQDDRSEAVRVAALNALKRMQAPELSSALELALRDRSKEVRSGALSILPSLDLPPAQTANLLNTALENGSLAEQQSALVSLGKIAFEHSKGVLEDLFAQLKAGTLPAGLELELGEAIRESGEESMIAELDEFEARRTQDNPMIQYAAALEGGSRREGQNVFVQHEAAQCVRCHAVGPYGSSVVGPNLGGIANRLSREQLLEALVDPSARLAPGFGTVMLTLDNGEKLNGVLMEETKTELIIKTDQAEPVRMPIARITQRREVPSAMPPMGRILSMRELRDLVAFLAELK